MVKVIISIVAVLLLLVLSTAAVLFLTLPPRHVVRCLFWLDADIRDYEKFPHREIQNAPPTFHFEKEIRESLPAEFADIRYDSEGQTKEIGDLERFLASTQTTAFIIIRDDIILYEKYFNGYERDSINTSFSMAKSFDSALVGIAVDEGFISSIDDPIVRYIPELQREGFESITIRNLITMTSGLSYKATSPLYGTPWGDDAKTYYSPDLRSLALSSKVAYPPGIGFHYNNYNPLLVGMILERATGQPVAHYLQEKIWKQLGMEFPASWSLDSEENGFEKMESGINARSIDFAKFGRLVLRKGNWDGKQIISEKWAVESTSPIPDVDYDKYYLESCKRYRPDMEQFFQSKKGYYKYFWWGLSREEGNYDFSAEGNKGQLIYVSPSKNAVVVRNGEEYGGVDNWMEIIFQMVDRL